VIMGAVARYTDCVHADGLASFFLVQLDQMAGYEPCRGQVRAFMRAGSLR